MDGLFLLYILPLSVSWFFGFLYIMGRQGYVTTADFIIVGVIGMMPVVNIFYAFVVFFSTLKEWNEGTFRGRFAKETFLSKRWFERK